MLRMCFALFGLLVAMYLPVMAQANRFMVPEYLGLQFTAPDDAPASIVIAGKEEPGERLIVTGRTLDGKMPVAGVSLYLFHTDTKGRYATGADNRMGELNPRLHGSLRTDADGRYRYETTRPGSYDNSATHVHYVVKADGYEPLLLALQFEDDPIVIALRKAGKSPLGLAGDAFVKGPCKARPDCVLTQPVKRDSQGVSHVIRDIQMVKK